MVQPAGSYEAEKRQSFGINARVSRRDILRYGVDPFQPMPAAAGKLVADALLTDDPSKIGGDVARTFRAVASANPNNDMKALAACIQNFREPLSPSDCAGVDNPVLIVGGGDDILSQDPEALADAIKSAKVVKIPGKNHLTVLTDQRFKHEVLAFLQQE